MDTRAKKSMIQACATLNRPWTTQHAAALRHVCMLMHQTKDDHFISQSLKKMCVIPHLCRALSLNLDARLLQDVLFVLALFAGGTTEDVQLLVKMDAPSVLMALLDHKEACVHARASWVLGNIAADCLAYHNLVIKKGAATKILSILKNMHPASMYFQDMLWGLVGCASHMVHRAHLEPALIWMSHRLSSASGQALQDMLHMIRLTLQNAQPSFSEATITQTVVPSLLYVATHAKKNERYRAFLCLGHALVDVPTLMNHSTLRLVFRSALTGYVSRACMGALTALNAFVERHHTLAIDTLVSGGLAAAMVTNLQIIASRRGQATMAVLRMMCMWGSRSQMECFLTEPVLQTVNEWLNDPFVDPHLCPNTCKDALCILVEHARSQRYSQVCLNKIWHDHQPVFFSLLNQSKDVQVRSIVHLLMRDVSGIIGDGMLTNQRRDVVEELTSRTRRYFSPFAPAPATPESVSFWNDMNRRSLQERGGDASTEPHGVVPSSSIASREVNHAYHFTTADMMEDADSEHDEHDGDMFGTFVSFSDEEEDEMKHPAAGADAESDTKDNSEGSNNTAGGANVGISSTTASSSTTTVSTSTVTTTVHDEASAAGILHLQGVAYRLIPFTDVIVVSDTDSE